MQAFLFNNFVEYTCPSLVVKPQVLKKEIYFSLAHASEKLLSVAILEIAEFQGNLFFFFFMV